MPKKKSPPQSEVKPRRHPRAAVSFTPLTAAIGLAGFDLVAYNTQFLRRSGSAAANDAVGYGVRVETIESQPGQPYWKVIGVHHLSPDENRDRHNAFVEVLDEAGRRVKDGNLRLGWIWEGKADGPADPKRLDKSDDEPATDVPIEKNMTVTLWLEGAGASERVSGLHTRHEDETGPGGGRNSRFHHSYYIVFQRTQRGAGVEGQGGATGGVTGGETGGEGGMPTTTAFRFLRWPTDTVRIIQPFGVNPEFYRAHNLPGHEGIDIVAAENDPIYCVAPGQVKMINTPTDYLANNHPYGVHVRVQHADGYETIYAHCKELRVQVGQTVEAGQVLGVADHTGNVFGDPPDHLHLTLKHVGETTPGYPSDIIDPMPFLRPLLEPFAGMGATDLGTTPRRVAEKLGLNCNAPVDGQGAITARLADPRLVKETGVGWVRLNFIVRAFAGPDDPQWVATYRRIIDGLRGQGLQIYGLIGAEAVVNDPGNQFRHEPPAEPVENEWIRTYAQNVRKIVERFGQDVPIIESFNEPNDWHRTPGDPTAWEQAWIHPAWFAIMLQRVYEAVRDLEVTLVSGPLLSTADGNDAAPYLREVYEAGRARFQWGQPSMPTPFAGVGFHPYVLRDSFDPQAEIPARYRQYVDEVREVIRQFDAPNKPLFLSEIGWQNPDDRQAACMEVGLGCALDDPAVALSFWYGMQDDAGESYGLYRKEGLTPEQRKPIYDRFVALATNPRTVPTARVAPKPSAARFVAELDSVPDDTLLAPGRSFSKVWRLQNTGATTWEEGYQFVLVGGQSLGAPHRLSAPHCRPGQMVDLTVAFVTPPEAGQYLSTWSLADAHGAPFGEPVWTRIQVAAPIAAPAPAAPPLDMTLAAAATSFGLPTAESITVISPLQAAALGVIYQTYWLRVLAAASEANPQQAIQSAGDDAVARIRGLMAG
jgi:hypothetical protein